MLPRVLIFQHADYCPPGTLGEHLATDGIRPTVVNLCDGEPIPDLERFDILMVMGGAMNVWEKAENPWLVPEKAAIRRWVEALDRPYLGVCLGHQLLAEAVGGTVTTATRPEVALLQIQLNNAGQRHALFSGLGSGMRVVQWHGAEVKSLPSDAVVLGSTADCPVSAFAVASAAFGLQCHVEATTVSVDTWCRLPEGGGLLERLHGISGAPRLQAEVAAATPDLRANSRRFYDNFMSIARSRLQV